jgi:hypothetical protein
MKITVYSYAEDTDNGTSSAVYATERECDDALLEAFDRTREDFEAWQAENDPDGDLWDFKEDQNLGGDLDTFHTETAHVDVDLCAQPLPPTGREQVAEAIECLKRARDLLKASDNKQTLARVRLALSSAKGAARIQIGREVRAPAEPVELFEGWTTADQAEAQRHGWEMTLFGDGHVAIVADDDSDVFTSEQANITAYDHVQVWAAGSRNAEEQSWRRGTGDPEDLARADYYDLCAKAAAIEKRTAAACREAGEAAEPYSFSDVLERYDQGELNDEQAIAELETRGWAEHRARTILEQHIAA